MRSAGETAAARLRAILICVAVVCCMGQSCGTFPPAPVYEEEVLAEHPDAPPDGANDPATPAAPELAIVSGVSPDGWSVDFAVTTLDGQPLPAATFTWDFGDGSSSEGSSVSHTYTKAGIYAVSVSAVIGAGITAYVLRTETGQVIQAPAATEPALRVTPADGLSSLGGRGGPFEPAGRSYTLTSTAGEPLTWSASATEPWLLVSPASGTLAPGAAVEVAVRIDAALAGSLAPGAYEAMVGFVDTTGADPAARPRSSTGRPVKIVVGADKTVRIAGSVRKNGAGFAGVTVTADGGPSSVTDAAGAYALEVPAGWTGTVAPSMAGETFDPPSQAFSALAGDVVGADFAAVVVVTNQPPMAVAQSVSVAQGGSLAITLSGSDAEGDALDFALDASPSHGVLSGVTVLSAATARVVYTPASGYSGSDAFSFTVSDGAGISSAALVSITVVPVATGVGPILVPGSGFTGPTDQPAAVGDPLAPGYDAKAIARWDVVPYQTFTGDFNVGVVAFHMNGIDRVDLSVNGGPWVAVREMTVNPQTANHSDIGVQTDGIVEYWATLRASDFADGPVEVRAIAWPKVGVPRVLGGQYDFDNLYQGTQWTGEHCLTLFANGHGSLSDQVVELDSGEYIWGTIAVPFSYSNERWVTIRAKPGAQVVINRGLWSTQPQFVRLQGLGIRQTDTGAVLTGSTQKSLWIDNCRYQGPGMWVSSVEEKSKNAWWTGTTVRDSQFGHAKYFVRNCRFELIGEDVMKLVYFVAKSTVYNQGDPPAGLTWHPGVIANPISHDNRIYYGVEITSRSETWAFRNGTDHYWEHHDVAVVNCWSNKTTTGNTMWFLGGQCNHFYVLNCTFLGDQSFGFRLTENLTIPEWRFSGHNVVFENINWYNNPSWLPNYLPLPGVEIR